MNSTAAVIGAGTMGVGIAYVFATSGYATTVVEPDAVRVRTVKQLLADAARDGVRRGKLDEDRAAQALEAVTYVERVEDVPLGADIIVETVPERLDLKVAVLKAAEAREPGILSTNTSALSVDQLAGRLARPERFLGTHFFNPVWSIQLVELVVGLETSDECLGAAQALVESLGKQSATVRDSPGFATSRLDLVASLEAMRMLEEGVADAADIDRAMVLAYRHPVGPLYLSDIVGLDVRLDISESLGASLGPRFEPPQILRDLVARGHLGQKSGQGFYPWPA